MVGIPPDGGAGELAVSIGYSSGVALGWSVERIVGAV
jgi:hypothetical protein